MLKMRSLIRFCTLILLLMMVRSGTLASVYSQRFLSSIPIDSLTPEQLNYRSRYVNPYMFMGVGFYGRYTSIALGLKSGRFNNQFCFSPYFENSTSSPTVTKHALISEVSATSSFEFKNLKVGVNNVHRLSLTYAFLYNARAIFISNGLMIGYSTYELNGFTSFHIRAGVGMMKSKYLFKDPVIGKTWERNPEIHPGFIAAIGFQLNRYPFMREHFVKRKKAGMD
ncbi:MAG: hypothetical protein GC181_09075 [Bacteroidetes bacterium]|nr:hypothetical protein [Bacteroidota bacterium]